MALPSSSSSCSSSFSYGFTYDVFLSFRGSDTRFGFTGNLYEALRRCGIRTFIDDGELKGGDEITPSLVKAIEESRIAIPVFSLNYASSSFCLDELVNINQCVKAKGRLVLPVFYDVEPSQVRHHNTGCYGGAIAEHEARFKNNKENYTENMERLNNWKMALKQTANLSGKHFILGKEYEHEFIGKIVKEVSNNINRAPLHVADYPVGLGSRVLQVRSLLDVGFDDKVCMVGIYGIGGMGKSTLARAIYNSIADQFDGLCFLHNVREKSAKHGLEHLQEKLLSKTIGLNIKVGDTNEGIPIIKQRLHRKKVLLILDDVDKLKQLQAMAGGLDWFGLGSRVIITSRYKHLLESHGIERTYEVDELNEKEALELLRWKAFKNNTVDSSYEYNLNRALRYASGLPLALEVVGSNLFGKNIEKWKSILDRYEKSPNKEIQQILRVSYDALEVEEQNVFLDISCCFKGYTLKEVEDILYAHYGDCMKHQIDVLVEKSLIKISIVDCVTLHDLIEDMGKEIVRQESWKEPEKRSRLWSHQDIVQVLEENSGTGQIEIIHLNFPLLEDIVELKGDEFKKMTNLKTLIIKDGLFSKGPVHLPNSLRVLEWHRYPSKDMLSNFYGKKLSICKILGSCLTPFELSSSLKRFVNMRVLNLDWCPYLTETPDVSSLTKLEKFSFQFCRNLITMHNSVGLLNKLKILNAEGCNMLKSFPPLELTCLQHLQLSNCCSLENFPEILGEMKNITKIAFSNTSIKELPISFQKLTGLCELTLCGRGMLRLPCFLPMMPNLQSIGASYCLLPTQNEQRCSTMTYEQPHLDLGGNHLSNELFQIGRTWFANLQSLDLSWNNFTTLPEYMKECHFLWRLVLDDCERLEEIIGIPPNLVHLSARYCHSLTPSCRSRLLNQDRHEAGETKFNLPGTASIPEWFEHKIRGQSFSFWFRNKIPSIALFFVNESMHNPNSEFSLKPKLSINGYYPDTPLRFDDYVDPFDDFGIIEVEPNHTFLWDLQLQDMDHEFLDKALLKNEWNHAEITYVECLSTEDSSEEDSSHETMSPCRESGTRRFEPEGRIIESGIHIFKERSSMEDIQFTNPY